MHVARKLWVCLCTLALTLVSVPVVSFADTNSVTSVSAGDTAWVLVSAALVLLMTPGLAFFYGGLVRRKNVITTLFQVFAVIAIVSVQWVLFGYSLAFGPDFHHIIGGLQWSMFHQVGAGPNPAYAATIPHMAFGIFQMMFAIMRLGDTASVEHGVHLQLVCSQPQR